MIINLDKYIHKYRKPDNSPTNNRQISKKPWEFFFH